MIEKREDLMVHGAHFMLVFIKALKNKIFEFEYLIFVIQSCEQYC